MVQNSGCAETSRSTHWKAEEGHKVDNKLLDLTLPHPLPLLPILCTDSCLSQHLSIKLSRGFPLLLFGLLLSF